MDTIKPSHVWQRVTDRTTGRSSWAVAGPWSTMWPGEVVEVHTGAMAARATVTLGLLCGARRKLGDAETTVLAFPQLPVAF